MHKRFDAQRPVDAASEAAEALVEAPDLRPLQLARHGHHGRGRFYSLHFAESEWQRISLSYHARVGRMWVGQ